MKNTKNTQLVGFELMSKAETEKVLGGPSGKKRKRYLIESVDIRPKKK